jgi:hypothetical protein
MQCIIPYQRYIYNNYGQTHCVWKGTLELQGIILKAFIRHKWLFINKLCIRRYTPQHHFESFLKTISMTSNFNKHKTKVHVTKYTNGPSLFIHNWLIYSQTCINWALKGTWECTIYVQFPFIYRFKTFNGENEITLDRQWFVIYMCPLRQVWLGVRPIIRQTKYIK